MMIVLGYFASLLIGLSLGLLGSGGSILTLPVLVYLFQVEPEAATAYSLVIVGTTALVGVLPRAFKGEVDFGTALLFGLPSIAAVYATRAWLMPALPDQWGPVTKSQGLMLLFAVLMVLAARGMLKGKKVQTVKRLKPCDQGRNCPGRRCRRWRPHRFGGCRRGILDHPGTGFGDRFGNEARNRHILAHHSRKIIDWVYR